MLNNSSKISANTPLWSPAKLTNLKAWYKSDKGISIATGVNQWFDQSGNNNHLNQVTLGRQPTVISSEINGYPGLIFDGVDDYLQTSFTLVQPETVFIIVKMLSWTLNDQIIDGAAGDSMLLQESGGGTDPIRLYGGAFLGPSLDLPVGNLGLITAIYNGASSLLQINNATIFSGNGGTASASGFTIGAGAGGSFNAHIVIAEAIVLSGAATNNEINLMKAYAKNRYNISM